MPNYKEDSPLKQKELKDFSGGYNSYSASRLLVKDNEIPQGASNVVLDDNGSVTKRGGKVAFGAEISSGHSIMGMGLLKNSTYNSVIVACNTSWYKVTSSTKTALTGVTFTADKQTTFNNFDGKLWGANNTDDLAYTSDNSTVVSISSNGNIGMWPTYYNGRIYMTNASNPDRVYYSNGVSIDLSTSPPTYTGLDTANLFNTNLSASPKKNAGYFNLLPGGGVVITRLFKDNSNGTDYLFAHTKEHGIWRISPVANNSDGTLAHSIVQFIPNGGVPAGLSVVKANNDQWLYDGYNFSTLGDVATYLNPRITPKGGRVKSEVVSIANSGRSLVAGGFYNSKLYFAYQSGSYNDRVIIYDTILNAWSSPLTNWNISSFMVYEEDDGTRRFLGGSSDSSDSYVYQIDTGTSDVSSGIDASFTTKSTNCDKPGLIKRLGFVDVFYGMVFGTLDYQVYADETLAVTGSLQLGNTTSNTVGIGSVGVGDHAVGSDYPADTTFASLAQNDSFRIECEYTAGKRFSVYFSNSNPGENFKINSVSFWYLEGNIYEQQ